MSASASLNAVGLDLEKLLEPVSEAQPAGEDISRIVTKDKTLLMAEIEEKRKAIAAISADEQADPTVLLQSRRRAWREIETMAGGALTKGKELRTAVTFAQAVIAGRGWEAVGPILLFLRRIQERFADGLYPRVETDEQGSPDFTLRLAALERLDHDNFLPSAIRLLPITDPKSGAELSWADYRQTEIMRETPRGKDEDPEVRRQAIEKRTKAFEAAVSKSSLAYYENLVRFIESGQAELAALQTFVEEQFAAVSDDERPSFRSTAKTLEECHVLARQLLHIKGGGKPPQDALTALEGTTAAGEPRMAAASGGDPVALLEQALAQLRLHQHHNPAVFLIEEAIRWTKMPIGSWYLETTEDANLAGYISKLMRGKPPETTE